MGNAVASDVWRTECPKGQRLHLCCLTSISVTSPTPCPPNMTMLMTWPSCFPRALLFSRWGILDTPKCICGTEEQSANHIIFDCNILRPPNCLEDLRSPDINNTKWLEDLVEFVWTAAHTQKEGLQTFAPMRPLLCYWWVMRLKFCIFWIWKSTVVLCFHFIKHQPYESEIFRCGQENLNNISYFFLNFTERRRNFHFFRLH